MSYFCLLYPARMLLAIFPSFLASSVVCIHMREVTRKYLAFGESLIGGYDADLPPARMVLGRIQVLEQLYNLEWPNVMLYFMYTSKSNNKTAVVLYPEFLLEAQWLSVDPYMR